MSENDIAEFKKNVQCAFQKGFEDVFGKCEETILPEKDIDQSLNGKGSVAYKAVLDGETSYARYTRWFYWGWQWGNVCISERNVRFEFWRGLTEW